MDSMTRLGEILKKSGMATTFDKMTPKEREQFRVDSFNSGIGTRNEEDGYNCDRCRNKAIIARLVENPNGTYSHFFSECKCEEIRRSILRMKKSGLKDIIKDYTFDKFVDADPWQKTVKEAAMEYAKHPEGWFFLGGQSGAGKTHLCTAICREFLLSGKRVVYMLWRDDIVKIKAAVNDSKEYSDLIDKYKKTDVLYIDDLFKTGKAQDGSVQKPTGADINVAFEIINYRYNNPSLLTIISSECTEDELIDIDEAVGGRIFERSKSISIARDRNKNYRFRKAVTL